MVGRPSTIFASLLVSLMVSSVAQTPATIDIDTTATTPLHPHFSGLNDEVSEPIEYFDYRFNTLALKLNPGWVRFPGGISGDAYNWQTGQEEPSWVTQFAGISVVGTLLPAMHQYLAGKGGARFIDAANRVNMLGATLIVCANAFTDTPESIGKLAAYAKANGIPVAAWELSNEPYFFSNFYKGAVDYLNKVKPYRDAIKAADPNAIVAVFLQDASRPNSNWDAAIAAYPNKYWDAVTYHFYPAQSQGAFSQWMADENAVLVTSTDTYVAGHVLPISPPGTKVLVSEFLPSMGNAGGTLPTDSLTNATLYGAIYVAEFTMRMSTVPALIHVGSHAIAADSGVLSTNEHYKDVSAAAAAGTSIDTLSLEFGYYYAAQANGVAILNSVINHATKSNKTMVTGGATVPATGVGQTPALYSLAYTNASGGLSILITNKSATAHSVTVRVNGTAASGPFPLQFITGTDPSTVNTASHPNAIAIQTATSGNPIPVPPYSVLRADISNPPVATFVNSASFQPGSASTQQLVTAFASGFASQTILADAQPLPTVLGDTTITISDSAGTTQKAPLLYVSPSQASFLIPSGIAPGSASVAVQRSGSTVLTGPMNIVFVSPGLFAANGNGAGVAAATALRVGSGGSAALPVFSCQTVALSCLSTPLALGGATDTVYVALYGTGIRGAKSVQVFVAGESVPVQFAGAQGQFAGLDQVNISIPRALAGTGEASVYLIADGATSNMVTINIQ